MCFISQDENKIKGNVNNKKEHKLTQNNAKNCEPYLIINNHKIIYFCCKVDWS